MAKRRSKTSEERRKKFKKDADGLLLGFEVDVDDIDRIGTVDGADWDNQEQSYERKPRNVDNIVESLPIKVDGKLERVHRVDNNQEEKKQESDVDLPLTSEVTSGNDNDESDKFEHLDISPLEKLVKMKEEVAGLASKLLEDPEPNVSCLTRLRKMSMSKNIVLSQLAIVSLVSVFKSLAPGYKIRTLTERERKEKVSKDVAKLRTYEQQLIYNYKIFIDHLGQLAKVSRLNSSNNNKIGDNEIKLGELSIKACCDLILSSLRHFNNRNDLLTIIIRRLNRKPADSKDLHVFTECIRVLETLLVDDKEHGEVSYDLTKILSKTITDKKFRVDESVVNVFLSLSLLDDYKPKDEADKPKETLNKKDRVHLSKKQRKVRKEMKEIEQEMEKAQQSITLEEREKYQSDVLKMLLKLYLEILKSGSGNNDNAKGLMGCVLEGLSRFGRMANFDLLGDFLQVLREIMTDIIDQHSLNEDADDGLYTATEIRTVLLCIATGFSLSLNHSSVGKLPMTIDLSKFISSFYNILADLSLDCDLEFSHKSLRLLDPLSESTIIDKPSVNVLTKAELLLNCLDAIFFKSRNGSNSRSVSFIKRLYICMLQTPEKTSMASLKFIGKLVNKYGDSVKGLWNTEERINGEGAYDLGFGREVELDRCNSDASTLWENVLLDKHYNPMVKDGSRSLMKLSKQSHNI